MCGICGIIDPHQRIPAIRRDRFVQEMNKQLIHRGPDGAGSFANANCSLAMRRLAIIDLKTGDQPVFNETGDIGIFFNGEIYNYRELRAALLKAGHQFKTNSDTEVLVHLYEEHGPEMLSLLQGMFAFCLFDQRRKRFLLARDRFGEKPLYFHLKGQVLSFSSEVASLLQHKEIPRRLNLHALPYYFRTSLIPEPMTLLEDVKCLRPGYYLHYQNGQWCENSYFDLDYPSAPDICTETEAIRLIRPLLEKAVRKQTVSDVPIAAFLSGGIDSSTVVALLQEQSTKPVRTFHVRFEDQAYDESAVARKVAEYCGTDHHELVVPDQAFDEDIFWKILDHVGLPFRDSSAIPTFLISKAIGEEVKVALSGDGGDELFGGYGVFQWYQKILRLQVVPRPFRVGLQASLDFSRRLPGLQHSSLMRKVRRAVGTSLLDRREIPIALNEFFPEPGRLYQADEPAALNGYSGLKTYPENAEQWSDLRQIMYYRMHHTLPANMLVKVDRMSMAASLEVRTPFLDPELFAAAARLPDDLLIRNGQGKYLIRKIMQDRLPPEVFDHPKMGFNIPLYKYQNEAFKNLARDLLFTSNPLHHLLDQRAIQEVYELGIGQRKNTAFRSVFQSAHQLWMMMQLFAWVRRFEIEV